MRKKFAALLMSVLLALTGCTGGSIYSNYRDIAQLLVVRTMGFDSSDGGGVTLSVAAEGSGVSEEYGEGQFSPLRLCADAPSVTLAQEKLQGFGEGRQLFFGHSSYIVLGQSAIESGVTKYFDCLERDAAFRLSVPVFALKDGSAASLILHSGGETTDASRLLHAAAENLSLSGRARVYTAAQIISALDRNGAALICAVRTVPAASSSSEAEPEETAIEPDGYIIIYKGRAAGEIPEPIAPGVGILKGETGTLAVSLGDATAELDRVSRELEPVTDANGLAGLNVKIRLKASLAEAEGEFSVPELESRLAQLVKGWVGGVLECSLGSGCDALHLAAELPRELRDDFAERMGQLYYNVEVTAELQRSYHLDLREGRQ